MAFRQFLAGATVGQAVAYNAKRLAITIKNIGAAQVFIGQDSPDLAALGFPLSAGEYLSLIASDGDDPTMGLYAITAAGTADLRIQESFPP
jgi:hypothetical protein